jgi:hypothetical protein
MSEIKRYSLTKMYDHYGHSGMSLTEQQQGEWVRWEDVERLIESLLSDDVKSVVDEMLGEMREINANILANRVNEPQTEGATDDRD